MDYGFDIPDEFKDKEWWDVIPCPSDIADQNFGFEIDEKSLNMPEQGVFQFTDPKRPEMEIDSGYSKVVNNDIELKIELSLGSFMKEEVKVSYVHNLVTICMEHEARKEGKGDVSRKLERTYVLPFECDVDKANVIISSKKLELICKKRPGKKEAKGLNVTFASFEVNGESKSN